MPVEYVRDDAHQLIRTIAAAAVTSDDAITALERRAAEGTWHYPLLVDLRHADIRAVDDKAVARRIGGIIVQHGLGGPIAIVAREPGTVSKAQTFAIRVNGIAAATVEVFWDVGDAEQWLAKIPR